MELDRDVNYVVSGLERSGTSMLMQILKAGELPVSFDKSRKPDDNNPKGYYELEGGKIINKLMEGSFPIGDFKGKVIKNFATAERTGRFFIMPFSKPIKRSI